ncbi:MAG: D-alanyl-D-alanine carboxypeptidase [Oscillospiraceae bacterium]|jgi:D-alanyl-D-alanine carboxypeptidase/D-alanyl-D-alanine carboxypeptidase (penicillin-binding protein 5/6)|nr:D-alanyl-D-alanine carboxypeptidase [Oscillospiraceae bacterium]MCI1990814.1 D-alanyl-D-alanine carboxypeptidase [Oscillospiraceae bacterium]MCI2035345.1 D-alanyl-D-alanine carboxypeptidase [Oscillospiraceae bacterium]
MTGKKIFCFCFAAFCAALFFPVRAAADGEPQVSARSAVVMNADDGSVLYAKNEHERRAIASTTKIMTSLLTLEAAAVNNKTVTITADVIRVEGSSMGLKVGDRLTLHDLAAGMLLVSGNDAANSAAVAVGGTTDRFAAMMNAKAAALGMKDTHFVTPSGLDDDNHYSTAYDMALLADAAMQNGDFSQIVSRKSMRIQYISPNTSRSFQNHNKLLRLYPYCDGVKTGFTKKAGRCLVSSAEKNGVRLIAVTLNDPDDWKDHEALLNFGFSSLTSHKIDDSAYRVEIPVVGGERSRVPVSGASAGSVVTRSEENLTRTVELPRFVYAPVETGQVLGRVRYVCGGKTVAETELAAAGNIPGTVPQKNWLQNFWDGIRNLFSFH